MRVIRTCHCQQFGATNVNCHQPELCSNDLTVLTTGQRVGLRSYVITNKGEKKYTSGITTDGGGQAEDVIELPVSKSDRTPRPRIRTEFRIIRVLII